MEYINKKFCHYLLNGKNQKELDEINTYIKENILNYKQIKKQSQSIIKKLKKNMSALNYGIDIESFHQCLEKYISIKDDLTDEEKINYLQNLYPLSEIYDINLRSELEKHISYKKVYPKEELLERFIKYQINPETNIEEYNELKKICQENKYDYNELQKEAFQETEPLKESVEELGFATDFNSFCNMLDKYCEEHSEFTEELKEKYLRCLLKLSQIYEIDLRSELVNYINSHKQPVSNYSLSKIIPNLSNPLDNQELLNTLLEKRLNEGNFDINNLELQFDKQPKEGESEDFTTIQAELTHKLYEIFLNKINNFSEQDLNSYYLNILSEEDLTRLPLITIQDITKVIKSTTKGIPKEKVIEELNISESLYNFLKLSIETTNFTNPHIGIGTSSIFNTNDTFYTIRIYINTPQTIETVKFLSTYIEECVLHNISYDCTGLTEEKTILYATINDIDDKISILESIKKTQSDLIKTFGTPNHGGATINNSYYSISHAGLLNENNSCVCSYNEYFNNLCEVAYYRIISKIIINTIEKETEKEIINKFIDFDNIEFITDVNDPIQAKYNGIEFNKVKDLINTYIPLIINTLKKHVESKDNLTKEFKKAITYIYNICEGRNKKEESNIAISLYLENASYREENS